MDRDKIPPWMWEESQQPEGEWTEDAVECAASQGEEERGGRGMHRRAASHGEEEREGRTLADLSDSSLGDKEHDCCDMHQRAAEATSGAWRERDMGVGKQVDHDGKPSATVGKQLEQESELLDQDDKPIAGVRKSLDYDPNLATGNSKNEDDKLLEGGRIMQDDDLSDPRFVGGRYLRRSCARAQGGSKCGDCGEWHEFACPSCSQSLSGFACSLCGHGGLGVCRTCGKRPSSIDDGRCANDGWRRGLDNDGHNLLGMDTDSGTETFDGNELLASTNNDEADNLKAYDSYVSDSMPEISKQDIDSGSETIDENVDASHMFVPDSMPEEDSMTQGTKQVVRDVMKFLVPGYSPSKLSKIRK